MNKRIIYSIKGLYRDDFRITGYEFGEGEKTLAIVGSFRGNEVQQLYCCSLLVQKFKQLEEEERIAPGHKILIVPSANPYSINIQKRFWPIDNTDINRMFPGYNLGETTQRIAEGLFQEISQYKLGIQFSSYYMPGRFMPHIQMMDTGYENVEMAKQFGMPYVVKRKVRPYDTATLNYNWQIWNTQAFSFYTTTTASIDRASAGRALLSILTFLSEQGIVTYQGPQRSVSKVITSENLIPVRTARSGIFEKLVNVGDQVAEGTPLANIINPYDGAILETLYAPCKCIVFFMHDDPLTYANTAVFKLVQEE